MLLRSLSTNNDFYNGTLPLYSDHFLLSDNLQQPYSCPEHVSGLGLLITGKGNCNYYVNGIKNPVTPNNVLFVNRNSRLAVSIDENNTAPALLFFNARLPDLVYHYSNNMAEQLLEEPGNPNYDFSWLERIHYNPSLHQTISSLIALGQSCSSFASLKADIIIRNLFENLLRENQQAFTAAQNLSAVKLATRLEIYKRVAIAREWMEEQYNTGITLEHMATVALMNSQHFLRMFKQIYQITPHQYLIELRLKKAQQLLETTSLPVTEICNSIGFESIYSFCNLFKKQFGLAPSHFRHSTHN